MDTPSELPSRNKVRNNMKLPRKTIYGVIGVVIFLLAIWFIARLTVGADVVNSARPKLLTIAEKTYHQGEYFTLPIYVLDEDEKNMSEMRVLVDWGDGSQIMDQSYWHPAVTTAFTGSPTMRILAPHRYNSIGNYVLTITAVDSTGTASTMMSLPVHVFDERDTGSTNYPPSVFQVTDADLVNTGVEFPLYINTVDYSDINGDQTVAVNWGDETSDSKVSTDATRADASGKTYADHKEAIFNKKYAKPGVYVVTVTVTDGAKASTSDKYLIAVTDTTWKPVISYSIYDYQPKPPDSKVVEINYFAQNFNGTATTNTIDWGDGSPIETMTSTENVKPGQWFNSLGNLLNREANVYQFAVSRFLAHPRHTYAKDGQYKVVLNSTDQVNSNQTAKKELTVSIGKTVTKKDTITPAYGTSLRRDTTVKFTYQPNDLVDNEYAGVKVVFPSFTTKGASTEPPLQLLPDSEQPAGFDRSKLILSTIKYKGQDYIRQLFIPKGMPVSFTTNISFKSLLDGGLKEYKETLVVIEKGGTPGGGTDGYRYTSNPRVTERYSYPIVENDTVLLKPPSGTVLARGDNNIFTYDSTGQQDVAKFDARLWAPKYHANGYGSYEPAFTELLTEGQPDNFDASKIHPLDYTITSGGVTVHKTAGYAVEPGTSFKFKVNTSVNPLSLFNGRLETDFNRVDIDVFEKSGTTGKLISMNRYLIDDSSVTSIIPPGINPVVVIPPVVTPPVVVPAVKAPDPQPTATVDPKDTSSSNSSVSAEAAGNTNVAQEGTKIKLNNARAKTTAKRVALVTAQNKLTQAKETKDKQTIAAARDSLKTANIEYKTAQKEQDKTVVSTSQTTKRGFWASIGSFFVNIWSRLTSVFH